MKPRSYHPLRRHGTLALCSALALSACTVGKDYVPPEIDANGQWETIDQLKDSTATATKGARPPVWEELHDETLNDILATALAESYDLKIAVARIDEARAAANGADAELFPQISADAGITRQNLTSFAHTPIDTSKQARLTGNWDLDVFGANKRRDEAAGDNLEASVADRDRVRLELIAEISHNYIQLRSAQEQYAITLKNLAMQRDTLAVTRAQRATLMVSDLEVFRAQAETESTAARLPQLKTAMAAAIHRLEVLSGRQPGSWSERLSQPGGIPTVTQKITIGLPIDIIHRRPDIQVAERKLAAATALSAAALADLFPKVSLEGFFGASRSILLGSPEPWSATAGIMMPLLDFGRLSSQIDAADARQKQAFYDYKRTILAALEEVENNLTAYINEQKRSWRLAAAAENQAKAVNVAREQYKAGVVSQLDLLDAQRNQLDAQNAFILSKAAVADDLAHLYQALGETGEPAPAEPTQP